MYVRATSIAPRRIEDHRFCCGARRRRKGGAYLGQARQRRGVPSADVRVERRCQPESLRAEPHAVHADGMCPHVSSHLHAFSVQP